MSIGTRGINRQRPLSQSRSLSHGSESHQRTFRRRSSVAMISRSRQARFPGAASYRLGIECRDARRHRIGLRPNGSVALGQHPIALGQLAVAQRDQLLALLPHRVQLGELSVLAGDDPFALGDQPLQVTDMRGLPVQRGVAILDQRVLPEHFARIGLRPLLLGLFGVGEERTMHRRGRERRGGARGNDDEIHSFRRCDTATRDPPRRARPRRQRPRLRPRSSTRMRPADGTSAARETPVAQQRGEPVAIQLVAMELVDVTARVAVEPLVRRRNDQQARRLQHPRELGEHPRLVGGIQMLDRLERHDDVERRIGKRQPGARPFDKADASRCRRSIVRAGSNRRRCRCRPPRPPSRRARRCRSLRRRRHRARACLRRIGARKHSGANARTRSRRRRPERKRSPVKVRSEAMRGTCRAVER